MKMKMTQKKKQKKIYEELGELESNPQSVFWSKMQCIENASG